VEKVFIQAICLLHGMVGNEVIPIRLVKLFAIKFKDFCRAF
jgi:hypothetical protein